MKIQIDTENKTIKLENEVLLSDLVTTLGRLLPNGEWKKFTLETHTTITHWHEPYIVETYPRRRWDFPWYYNSNSMKVDNNATTAMYKADNNSSLLKSGVYNVEV